VGVTPLVVCQKCAVKAVRNASAFYSLIANHTSNSFARRENVTCLFQIGRFCAFTIGGKWLVKG